MSRRRSRPTPGDSRDALRRRRVAAIHAEAKRLQLDDATYRALLARMTGGKTSSKDCSLEELSAVIAELARLAGKPERQVMSARAFAGRPRTLSPLLEKIEALLTEARREWSYAHALARRMFRAQRLEWLNDDQLHRLVAALQIDANRRARRVPEADA